MDQAIEAQLLVLGNEVDSAEIPESCRQTVAWCLRQLGQLYTKFRATNESRYCDDITRLVEGIRHALTVGRAVSPASQRLSENVLHQLDVLHEKVGFPRLNLKRVPAPPARRKRAVGGKISVPADVAPAVVV